MCDWVLIGIRLLVGLELQALLGLDLVLNKVVEMISCTSKSKPLALPWGWTPRSDSGVRVRKHVVRNPTKVRINEKQIEEGQVMLLESTKSHVVSLTGVNEQEDSNIQDVGHDLVNEEGAVDGQENPVDASIVPTVAEKAKGSKKKRKDVEGASVLCLLNLVLRRWLRCRLLLPLCPSRQDVRGGGRTDYATRRNLHTQPPVKRSLAPDPPIMTTAVATTIVVDAYSVLVPRVGDEPVHASIFVDSTSAGMSTLNDPDARHSLVNQLAPPVLFSQLRGMDYDQLFDEFNVGA
nr:hypothetical protein [Tanacetum cinerariifolium]